MGVLDFNKCCFCIDLRVGVLIIGYLSLVGEIILLLAIGLMAVAGVAVGSMREENDERGSIQVDPQAGTALIVFSAILLLFLVLLLTFTIVLLVGVHQNKRGHVKAYLIYSIIFQVIFFIMFFASFATGPIKAGEVIKNVIIILLNVYFVLVIRNFYKKMDESPRGAALYNTA